LADDREQRAAHDTKVAVFYSISNCQAGLKGISFGNLLIKQVVNELQQELPGLETFVTLSPIPGLTDWLKERDDSATILEGRASSDEVRAAASEYLLTARSKRGTPRDPVARFHLGNGAQIHAVHGSADISDNGLRQSAGAMVNYEYDLERIEQNHERFVQHGEIALSPDFDETT
jgi:malonyl-CoA decarboxylase